MMKLVSLILILGLTIPAFAQRGRTIMGPDTLGQPTSPSSGQLPKRTNDITGEDMASASKMSSDADPTVPSRNPQAQEEESGRGYEAGPYKDGIYQHWDPDDSRR